MSRDEASTTTVPMAASSAIENPRIPWTLTTVLLAVFVVPTSISGTAVALPGIGLETGANLAELQWVVTAFNLTFACFTLAWGTLADIIGRKRAFAIGAAIFAAASVLSAVAPSALILDLARAMAGIGAAAIFSAGSAILATAFDGPARLRAFALAGAAVGMGVSAGPLLSGLLAETLGWRWIFVAHAGALALVLAVVPFVNQGPVGPSSARVDVPGTGVFVLTVFLMILGIIQGPEWGWTSPQVIGLGIAALAGTMLFLAIERSQLHPMLDLSLLRNHRFLGWSLGAVAPSFAFFALLTYLPSYLSIVDRYSAGSIALIMILLAAPIFVFPVVAGKLVQRGIPALTVLMVSLIGLILGDIALGVVGPTTPAMAFTLPLLLVGAATGLSAGLVDGQALSAVNPEKAGMAAGLLNTLRLGSETIAIALYGPLLTGMLHVILAPVLGAHAVPDDQTTRVMDHVAAGNLDEAVQIVSAGSQGLSRDVLAQSYDSAFHAVVWILAGISLVVAIAILLLLREGKAVGAGRAKA